MVPVIVYRVYADGRPDELIRGADIVGTPLASFAKILATSDKQEVFNGYCGAESGSVPVSAVSPAILISEIEIEKKDASQDLLPLLPSPSAGEGGTVRVPAALHVGTFPGVPWRQRCGLLSRGSARPRLRCHAGRAEAFHDADAEPARQALLSQLYRRRRTHLVRRRHARRPDQLEHATIFAFPGCAFASATTSSITPTGPAPTPRARATTCAAFPIEDENPLVLRQYLWLATDSAFKGSLQSIARKRAALRNVTVSEELPDFAPAQPFVEIHDYHAGEVRSRRLGRPHAPDFRAFSTTFRPCAIPAWNSAPSIPCTVS